MKATIQKRIGTIHKKLDKQFQQEMIQENPISILGGRTEVIHHFVYKAHSTFLRYEPKNAIPLTVVQHLALHSRSGIEGQIATIKGKEWMDWITEHRKVEYNPHRDKFYLEELLLKLEEYG